MKRFKKIVLTVASSLLAFLIVFTLFISVFNVIKTNSEQKFLEKNGYANPVKIDNGTINVLSFGNKSGNHTFVGISGLGEGDFCVSVRKATQSLEKANLFVYPDRFGYGLSGDNSDNITADGIVELYRSALLKSDISSPYILLSSEIGALYANLWAEKYPDEIEGMVIFDGRTRSDYKPFPRFLSVLGFSRFFKNKLCNKNINFSQDEQKISNALTLKTVGSKALKKETEFLKNYKTEIIKSDIPKVYISSKSDDKSFYDYTDKLGICNVITLNCAGFAYHSCPKECEKILSDYIKSFDSKIYICVGRTGIDLYEKQY